MHVVRRCALVALAFALALPVHADEGIARTLPPEVLEGVRAGTVAVRASQAISPCQSRSNQSWNSV
jgi:hypothetical protein